MKPSRSRNAIDESLLCQFPFSDGRACRMLRAADHPKFCSDHARRESQQFHRMQRSRDLADIYRELVSLYSRPHPASEIHRFTGRLLLLTVANRIRPRIAASLAHRVQLLLDRRDTTAKVFRGSI